MPPTRSAICLKLSQPLSARSFTLMLYRMTNPSSRPPGHLLVVDDDHDIRNLLRAQLIQAGFVVEIAKDKRQASATLASQKIDLVILDLTLPDGDGIDLCRELRAAKSGPAVIIVSARDASADRILGLETGADDYLAKPFEPRELIARVRNLLKRISGPSQDQGERGARYVVFGPWRLDLIKRRLVATDDSIVILSSAEFDTLLRFVRAPRRNLQRDDLIPERKATVWLDRSLDNRVYRLRRKLEQLPGGEGLIVAVRDRGYCLASDVEFQ